MRKLTLKDKFILIENQRYIEAKTESEEISIIKLLVWFYKINKTTCVHYNRNHP